MCAVWSSSQLGASARWLCPLQRIQSNQKNLNNRILSFCLCASETSKGVRKLFSTTAFSALLWEAPCTYCMILQKKKKLQKSSGNIIFSPLLTAPYRISEILQLKPIWLTGVWVWLTAHSLLSLSLRLNPAECCLPLLFSITLCISRCVQWAATQAASPYWNLPRLNLSIVCWRWESPRLRTHQAHSSSARRTLTNQSEETRLSGCLGCTQSQQLCST